ncbi:hypothetical protein [Oceanobacillus chungangensis]|uniref:hypothetical protein n=1 Tax=Oceanobacillus chungangensis TaxID=1229152 RepID=UPI0014759656|nr:hypothetical protein [Oceanobacillus chungangensis]
MKNLYPFLFILLTLFSVILNILGLMQLIPLYFTLPLLFISIYLTIYSLTQRNIYRRMR